MLGSGGKVCFFHICFIALFSTSSFVYTAVFLFNILLLFKSLLCCMVLSCHFFISNVKYIYKHWIMSKYIWLTFILILLTSCWMLFCFKAALFICSKNFLNFPRPISFVNRSVVLLWPNFSYSTSSHLFLLLVFPITVIYHEIATFSIKLSYQYITH